MSAGAAAAAAAASRRIAEKRERAHREATMTVEELAERELAHYRRIEALRLMHLERNHAVAMDRATGCCPGKLIEWNVNMVESNKFQSFFTNVLLAIFSNFVRFFCKIFVKSFQIFSKNLSKIFF